MAENTEVFDKVCEIVAEQLDRDLDEIKMDSHFRDHLEADSLDLVELIMAFEEEFGGDISDEEAQQINTVGQAVSFLENRSSE